MRTTILAALLAVSLTACGQGGGDSELQAIHPSAPPPPPPVAAFKAGEADQAETRRERLPGSPGDPAPEAGEQFIAYTYQLGLRLPQPQVEPLMQAHISACHEAGTAVCIVTNSNLSNQSDDYTSGYLSLRAAPNWIEAFLGEIDSEAEAAGGEITNRDTQAVDLTRAILDTDARLSAQITLKRRLEDLLANRDGELADFLQIERELARVTGDIESITSNLKAMRLRVSMSELSLNYETRRSLVSGGRTNPLARAFGDFFYNMSEALAAVITFFAVGLPWMVLIGIFLFIWLRAIWPWVRNRRSKT